MIFNLKELATAEAQNYLQHIIAPRPIGLVSTIDRDGNQNLSPFSFFNLFSSDPPIVIFSPARRVRDNTTKHTLENVLEVPEAVINIVDYEMVNQVSLAACEYPKGTDEFIKAGFTKEKGMTVLPPMVKESKGKLECNVIEVKPLGKKGGAGTLVICEVLCIHINDEWLDDDNRPDQRRMDFVARLGGNWYGRVPPHNLFEVEKPNSACGIGMDSLPACITGNSLLTKNELAQLANVKELPEMNENFYCERQEAMNMYLRGTKKTERLSLYAKELLAEGKVHEAWQVLLSIDN